MTAGRKPKPTKLKLIQGTYRPDRASPSEPKPQAVIPPCPKFLQGDAKQQYRKACRPHMSLIILGYWMISLTRPMIPLSSITLMP
jgi:hypothetical protein